MAYVTPSLSIAICHVSTLLTRSTEFSLNSETILNNFNDCIWYHYHYYANLRHIHVPYIPYIYFVQQPFALRATLPVWSTDSCIATNVCAALTNRCRALKSVRLVTRAGPQETLDPQIVLNAIYVSITFLSNKNIKRIAFYNFVGVG